MTTEPSPDPRDVIGRVLNAPAFRDDDRFPGGMKTMRRDAAYRDADALLAAIGTDPAVTQALLDALVAAGVLSEEWRHGNANGGGSIHATLTSAQAAEDTHNERRGDRTGYWMLEPPMPESTGISRRLVTGWAEVSD